MIIERRQKLQNQGRTAARTKRRLPLNLDLSSLDLMCNYVITENRNIKKGQYINLRNLMELLDIETYINDPERMKRINFIKKALEGKLIKGLEDPRSIVKYANGGLIDSDIIDIDRFTNLSSNDMDWVSGTVTQVLNSAFLYEEADEGIELFTRLKTADYQSISKITSEIEEFVKRLSTKFRQNKVETADERTFSLGKDMGMSLMETYNKVTGVHRKLKTGVQGLNMLLGGGFENTRLYIIFGLTGAGKSMTMLDMAYQIKRYNKGFIPKDPTKRPVVVYLTMENTVDETIERLFQMATGKILRETDKDDLERELRSTGELYLTSESPIDILVKYKANRSVDTSYLYTLTEDLEDEGYEVIALFLDHIKRIKAVEYNTDVRLELGNVSNELKNFAIIKEIPVITDSHLNREGARIIDNSQSKVTKHDLTRMLGKANVGESMLMIDNSDFSFIFNPEYGPNGEKYAAFKIIKTRVRTMADYICHPYMPDNNIKLIEDFYCAQPMFKETLYDSESLQPNNPASAKPTKSKIKTSTYAVDLVNLDEMDDEDNIYISATTYSSSASDEVEEKHVVPTCGNREEVKKPLVKPIYFVDEEGKRVS